MSDLSDLYQEVILDHNKRPRNYRTIEAPSHHAEGYNPLCGDRLNLFVKVDGDVITDVAFQGSGCAISKASASLMTDAVKGRQCFDVFQSGSSEGSDGYPHPAPASQLLLDSSLRSE